MISIVTPFYDERPNLGELVERLEKAAAKLDEPWEIVFVDDGSRDGGGESLKTLIASRPSLRLVRNEKNSGLTAAFWTGFREAKGEILATLDADLQNPPEEIPRLVKLLKDSGADIVAGIRQNRQDNWLKRISSKAAKNIRRAVTRDRIEDVGCSLRVFKRETLSAFLPEKGMHRFFLPLAEARGFKIQQVPVAHDARRRGQSKYGFWNRLLGPLLNLFMVKWRLLKKDSVPTQGPCR